MTETEFKQRTKDIALRVIKLVQSLPKNWVAETIGKQLLYDMVHILQKKVQ